MIDHGVVQTRSSAAITLSVWKALFLREALTRLFSRRAAWAWLLVEPVLHIGYMLVIFTVLRARTIAGADATIWLIAGMSAFFMFRRTATQAQNAIGSNLALFAYRQVKPIDTVLVRSALEGLLMVVVTMILFAGAALWGHPIMPADPLTVLSGLFVLWLLGLGWGLMTSVLCELIPEAGIVINFLMRPMYLISGVIVPLSVLPYSLRSWLLWNPLVHGLEQVRAGFFPYYHVISELSPSYPYACALVMVFLGLVLQLRFALRITQQ